MKRLGIVALLLGACVGVSNADTFDWSGGYIGAQIGGRWAKNFMEWNAPNGNSDSTQRPHGVAVGAYGGYNWQFGQVVTGIDAGLIVNTLTDDDPDWNLYAHVDAKAKVIGNVNARIGYAFGRILPHFTAGYSYGRYDNSYVQMFEYPKPPAFNESFSRNGWNIGAGVDAALTQNWIARAEYRYTDLGERDFGNSTTPFKFKQQTATLGIAYKF